MTAGKKRRKSGKRKITGRPPSNPYAPALQQAIRVHQQGQLKLAERRYRELLKTHGAQPDTLHFLGVLCHQRGQSEEAVQLIEVALQAIPQHADAHNNLGNIHKECNRFAQAESCYRRALECAPTHFNALANLALVLEALERPEEAFQALKSLLEQAPNFPLGQQRMGMFLCSFAQNLEHIEQAVTCLQRAIALDDADNYSRKQLGMALYMLERQEASAQVYRDWIDKDPANPVPRHMLAASGAVAAPGRAGDDYVRAVFDSFADSFDEQLLNNLGYRAPELLVSVLEQVLPAPQGALEVLDAGCGTGLCGPLIIPYASRLVGIDLSAGMIKKARARGGYDELQVAEITAFMLDHPGNYDLVLCADTLVYFGDLSQVIAATGATLRPGGWFGFTLEALARDQDYVELSASGRYRHSRPHVQNALTTAGFDDVRITSDSFRKELGHPVSGWLVLARYTG